MSEKYRREFREKYYENIAIDTNEIGLIMKELNKDESTRNLDSKSKFMIAQQHYKRKILKKEALLWINRNVSYNQTLKQYINSDWLD